MKHILSTKDFDPEFITHIFGIADSQNHNNSPLQGKIMASLFYEPSTRTRFSFEVAMLRLGGQFITGDNMRETSSVSKGETLEDTIKVLNNYVDVIVLRHFEEGASALAASISNIPIINAGDGSAEHPTQALLDLYTIKQELGRMDNLNVAIVGDLKNGRTVHSLIYLLSKYPNVSFKLVSPKELSLPQENKQYLLDNKINFEELEDLENVIKDVDVLYETRVQKERFDDQKAYEEVKDKIILTGALVDTMKDHSIIMHPLPRTNEIPPIIDTDHRAIYFKQTAYGLQIRKALLLYLFGHTS
jgi:aspartate carbamoyltransferase catalytic subunit